MEIARSQRYAHPFTIAYIDIDNFKAVNDRLGHVTGDRVLCRWSSEPSSICGRQTWWHAWAGMSLPYSAGNRPGTGADHSFKNSMRSPGRNATRKMASDDQHWSIDVHQRSR